MIEKWTVEARDTLRGLKYGRSAVSAMEKMLESKDDPELKERLKRVRSSVDAAELALRSIQPEQAELLNDFYIDRKIGYMDLLCQKFNCKRGAVYRLKNQALQSYTMMLFGMDRS